MKVKYPEKQLIFVLDNLWAHKSSLIMRIAQDKRIGMLLTPSNTPEFSGSLVFTMILIFLAIENIFGLTKKKMKDIESNSKEDVSKNVARIMFSFDKNTMNGFFRRTLKDLETFWIRLGRNKILSNILD